VSDVFVRDLATGTTERASVTSTGGEANRASDRPRLSRDGRFVAFVSFATNLAPGATHDGGKAIVRDRQGVTTTWALPYTTSTVVMQFLELSADGRYLSGHLSNGVSFVRDRFAGSEATFGPVGTSIYQAVVAPGGRYVAYIKAGQVYAAPDPL